MLLKYFTDTYKFDVDSAQNNSNKIWMILF